MSTRKKVGIFSAGFPECQETIDLVTVLLARPAT
jgi:hypothetical protein